MENLWLSVDGHALGEQRDSGLQRRRSGLDPKEVIRRPVTSLVQRLKKLPTGMMSCFACRQSFYHHWSSDLTSAEISNIMKRLKWAHIHVDIVWVTTDFFFVISFVLVVALIQWKKAAIYAFLYNQLMHKYKVSIFYIIFACCFSVSISQPLQHDIRQGSSSKLRLKFINSYRQQLYTVNSST